MRSIIKQFLETIANLQGAEDTVIILENDFDYWIDEFISNNPIGQAEIDLIGEIYNRARLGYSKYKTTTDRQDLELKDWVQHSIEEALDLSVYLRVIKSKLEDNESIRG